MTYKEYLENLKDKKVTVLGMGVSNTPLADALLSAGAIVTIRDKTPREKISDAALSFESRGATLILGDNYLENIEADYIFRTPGIRPDLPQIEMAVKNGAVLTSEMEAFFDVCPCKIIGVTGSDGKTTTTTIIYELLKTYGYTVHLGGNIGTPLFTKAGDMKKDDIVVVELSSFQLMTMKKSPEIAVITNLSPNHLDVHKDYEEYIDAKKNIFAYQDVNGKLVLNYDNKDTKSLRSNGKTIYFSKNAHEFDCVFVDFGSIYIKENSWQTKVMECDEIFIPGEHNIENFMAAFAAVSGLVSTGVMKKVAKEFTGVEHRIEFVRELNGVKYYNDSIASSPSRTIAGLHSFDRKVILIAGGKDKGVPFDSLGSEICAHVKHLVLTGLTAEKIKDSVVNAHEYKGQLSVNMVDEFKDAVIKARDLAQPGDIVILSPASTSFDRFKNFAERGNIFKEIVNTLE